jgi:2,3-bisphosphoglycerate-dependent phosphoglycerate mutase
VTRKTHTLVLLRHAQSEGQVAKGFTGWIDTELTELGVAEAQRCGRALRDDGFTFDVCHTSRLQRSTRTLALVLEAMNAPHGPEVIHTWRLNGRHYGSLQGHRREDIIAKVGKRQVRRWRHAYRLSPPALSAGDDRLPSASPLYADVDPALLPRAESHADADARVIDYWREVIGPQIQAGQRVLVTSHNSSIRGLVKAIEGLSDAQVADFKIEPAQPLAYQLDEFLRPAARYFTHRRLPRGLRWLTTGAARPHPAPLR